MGNTSAVNRGRSRSGNVRRPGQAGRFDGPAPVTRCLDAPGLREAVGIWIVVGVLAIADFATYARVPVAELYHVSRGGLAGGALPCRPLGGGKCGRRRVCPLPGRGLAGRRQ